MMFFHELLNGNIHFYDYNFGKDELLWDMLDRCTHSHTNRQQPDDVLFYQVEAVS